MKILITGNLGYVGPCVTRQLRARYPDAVLVGLDIGYFAHCLTGAVHVPEALLDAVRSHRSLNNAKVGAWRNGSWLSRRKVVTAAGKLVLIEFHLDASPTRDRMRCMGVAQPVGARPRETR